MKGVEYVVDERGKKKAVLLDLKIHGSLWEDFCDILKVKERENEARESLAGVKRKVLKRA
ncbi:MAG: hypothetical protein WBM78_18830 [Desulfobacterales bacterium]